MWDNSGLPIPKLISAAKPIQIQPFSARQKQKVVVRLPASL